MSKIILTLPSVTYAIKSRKLLHRAGIYSKVRKVNESNGERGCVHAVEIDGNDFYCAVSILQSGGISYSLYRGE